TYATVSGSALAATPVSTPAPVVLLPGVGEAGAATTHASAAAAQARAVESGAALNISDIIDELIRFYGEILRFLFEPIIRFLMDPIGNTIQLITDFLTNPLQALITWGPFLFAVAYQAISWIGASILYPSLLLLPLLITTLAIVAGVLERLLELFDLPPADAPAAEPAARAPAPARADQPNLAPVMSAPPPPSGAPISANTVSTGTAAAPGAPTAAAAPMVPYAVAGRDPGQGFTPTVRDTTGAKAPAATIPAAASGVAVSAAERRKRRRKQQEDIKGRGFADAYLDYDDERDQDQPP
ncbi:unnamed protein product, partial [marine sediment metagenome]